MAKNKTLPIEAGCRARTNERYAEKISATPREMTVLRPHRPIAGCWLVVWDGVVPAQAMSEYWLERLPS